MNDRVDKDETSAKNNTRTAHSVLGKGLTVKQQKRLGRESEAGLCFYQMTLNRESRTSCIKKSY